jgi:5-methylcytosine-specific restriction endonuclease McrA
MPTGNDAAFYATAEWQSLRTRVLCRDRYMCTTPGCGSTRRLTVDHIVSRRAGGADVPANLRTLCGSCDASIKEGADGRRRGGGVPRARGCGLDGLPLDPDHPWAADTP